MNWLIEKVVKQWKTSVAGVALSGAIMYVLNSWGCKFPSGTAGWLAWVVAVGPTLLGFLASDNHAKEKQS